MTTGPEALTEDAVGTRERAKQDLEVSIVVPCLNEAQSLAQCVDEALQVLHAEGITGEVVVADNGSTDGSPELAVLHGARVVHVAARGYGSAIRGGVVGAYSEFVVVADADGQHDFADVPKFVEKLSEGYELVIGNRFAGDMKPGAMTFSHRYIGNPLLSGLLRFLFHPGIHDVQCGMRGLTKTAFDQLDLRSTGFEFAAEMVVKGARHKLRMTEIPVVLRPDQRGRPPHLRTVPDGLRQLIFILMCSPNWLFVVPGGILLGLGFALVTWLFVGPQHVGNLHLQTRTQLFGVILASIGFDILSIGLFARVYSYSEPLRSQRRSLGRALKAVKLEQALALGGLFIAVGLIGAAFEFALWVSRGFGNFPDDSALIFWSLWFLIGVQTCFSSIFLSMIGISRGTWIGEPT